MPQAPDFSGLAINQCQEVFVTGRVRKVNFPSALLVNNHEVVDQCSVFQSSLWQRRYLKSCRSVERITIVEMCRNIYLYAYIHKQSCVLVSSLKILLPGDACVFYWKQLENCEAAGGTVAAAADALAWKEAGMCSVTEHWGQWDMAV